jgi:hypothetical protein
MKKKGLFRDLIDLDLDTVRQRPNAIWPKIQNEVFRHFGKLASLVWGELQNDEHLLEAYIKNYNIDIDINSLIKHLNDPTNGEKGYDNFVYNYAALNILKSFDDFDIRFWIDHNSETVLLLLGDQGNGKSSFIHYLTKNLPKDVIVFSDNLAEVQEINQVNGEIYQSLIEQIDTKVSEVGKEFDLDDDIIFNKRFRKELEIIRAYPKTEDSEAIKLEKEKRITAFIIHEVAPFKKNYSRDSHTYLKSGINFLKSFNKKICIVFDDIDKISDITIADKIKTEAREISQALNVPVVITMREVSAKRFGENSNNTHNYHIIAPSFQDIILKRFEIFKKNLIKSNVESIVVRGEVLTVEDYIRFVEKIMLSIINIKENITFFYMLSNFNIEMMLDYFKAILSSPHITDEEIINFIRKDSKLHLHKIIQTLLYYIYPEHNREVSYVINLYGAPPQSPYSSSFALLRIIILRIIKACGYMNESKNLTIKYKELKDTLRKLMYLFDNEKYLRDQLLLLHQYSIISINSTNLSSYPDSTEISILYSSYYYLNSLIYKYRYVQSIIPDTYLDYSINRNSLKTDIGEGVIDRNIENFIYFIEKCEEHDKSRTLDKNLYNRINENGMISELIKLNYEKEKNIIMSRSR